MLELRYECIFRLLMRKALFDHLTNRGIQVSANLQMRFRHTPLVLYA